jgi:hypothetical protein
MANVPFRNRIGRALLLLPAGWARIARFVATAWLLALGGIWAALQIHADVHEHVELPPLVHLLRDASLAVPMGAIALALGGLLASEGLRAARRDPAGVAGGLVWAVLAALVFAVLSVPGNQLHAFLFGAEEEAGGWLEDAVKDGFVVLLASLAVLVPAAMVRLAPWPPDDGVPDAGRPDPNDRPVSAGRISSVTAFERLGEQGVSRDA